MKQNITLSRETELIKKAKLMAAKKETSITQLLTDQLNKLISEEDEYESSKKRALANLRKGFHLGGRIISKREELHERR